MNALRDETLDPYENREQKRQQTPGKMERGILVTESQDTHTNKANFDNREK